MAVHVFLCTVSCSEDKVRLNGDVVQVCHNQQWGLVCYNRDNWDVNAAIVVCRQVGLSPRGIYVAKLF